MTGRHMARDRVAAFLRLWKAKNRSPEIWEANDLQLLVADLEALTKPRVVVRTLAQLQALPVDTILKLQGDRAGQIEKAELWDLDTGAEIEAKRLYYAGTDLYDNLLPDPSKEERDTLRRMLPAIVIDPVD